MPRVLLLGETGTGKELIARAIHERSQRRKENFVTLNCAQFPAHCLKRTFGHERGAFYRRTHSESRPAGVSRPRHLVLDEVGEMPIELQPKLLRALQERAYERVGSVRTKSVDMRLVAATNVIWNR